MKRCPGCNRTYTDPSLNFCLEDGTPLVPDVGSSFDPNATVRYTGPRDTSEPPPTEIFHPAPQFPIQPQQSPQHEWAPPPVSPLMRPPQKKSNAVWWVLGGVAVLAIIGVGLVIMIVAIASMSDNSNANVNSNPNSNVRVAERNANNANRSNENTNSNANRSSSANLPAEMSDDFSEQKWGIGNSKFGDIWYADDEYHMRSKEKTFLVMYAPTNDYNTENATVRVTARSVDSNVTTSGYGLIIHGEKSKTGDLEDYALLIYTGTDPQYQIVMHKGGNQTPIVPWTKSNVIRPGTSPNQLEARVKGADISFYINGQSVNHITDTENFKRGVAGLYTSDTAEIAFDDLEIHR